MLCCQVFASVSGVFFLGWVTNIICKNVYLFNDFYREISYGLDSPVGSFDKLPMNNQKRNKSKLSKKMCIIGVVVCFVVDVLLYMDIGKRDERRVEWQFAVFLKNAINWYWYMAVIGQIL